MAQTEGDRAAIIRFWSTVEAFSPPSVDKVNRQRRVYALTPDEPLPWQPGHELASERLRRGMVWRHVVYLGAYSLEAVYELLTRVFGSDDESYDERPGGESALAAFVVDGTGHPVPDSVTLSSCASETGQAVRHSRAAAARLADSYRAGTDHPLDLQRLLSPFVVQPEDARDEFGCSTRAQIDLRTLWACRDAVAEATGVAGLFPHAEIRVSSTAVSATGGGAEAHDFLNSFVVDDLKLVAGQARGPVGVALREYLRPNHEIDKTARVDVRTRLEVVLGATAPAQVPLGRWPSNPEHPLALGQQLAVNNVLRMTGADGAGVFAVNGPPGTGKTTMLRDVVAAVVVERARRLAELAQPREAFTGKPHTWKTGDYTRVVHAWNPTLTGFEMVVASANNGAVANVTQEIPAKDAIDPSWAARAALLDYFPTVADALLVDDSAPPTAEPPAAAWALIAARLGNKQLRGRFVGDFWYGRRTSPPRPADRGRAQPSTAARPGTPAAAGAAGAPPRPAMLEILRGFETSSPPGSWPSEVAEFRRALAAAAAGQTARDQTYGMLVRQTHFDAAARAAADAAGQARRVVAETRERHDQAAATAGAGAAERERLLALRLDHRRFRPGIVDRLFARAATRRWRERDDELAASTAAVERSVAEIDREVTRLAEEVRRAEATAAARDGEARHLEHELGMLARSLDEARGVLGEQFPDLTWWTERPRRERAAPWIDPAWNAARTELFFAALRLHKAFLQHAPREMRQSLQGAMDVVGGSAPLDLSTDAASEAWRALFFVVPVVSTTFASFARLFSHLGKESLGWLLIDESGQASPQVAVGALWRARRAVVVGDPLQLEPVSTLPFRVEQALRRDHGVDEQWLPARTSVQTVADRLNPLGTWLPGDEDPIWVGAPLTVHRRCDEPMFGVVNDAVYDGLMISSTSPAAASRFASSFPTLPESKWIDVVSDEAHGNWVPSEGQQVERILAVLAAVGHDMSEVMVIAPFRDIARNVAPLARRYPGLVAGTVHTAQGKEADVVVLVLGGDPARPGAKRWAASKPNLLNVAVSRAKRRIYVIGDRRAWSVQRHFDVLAARLPHAPPR